MKPVLDRNGTTKFGIEGAVAAYLQGVTDQWLLIAPHANPGMLEIFRDRDRLPRRDMVSWAGEFAGKYLTSAVQVLRLTGNATLRKQIRRFVSEFTQLQAEDGYLGPWPRSRRLTNRANRTQWTWDSWGHYHAMLGPDPLARRFGRSKRADLRHPNRRSDLRQIPGQKKAAIGRHRQYGDEPGGDPLPLPALPQGEEAGLPGYGAPDRGRIRRRWQGWPPGRRLPAGPVARP